MHITQALEAQEQSSAVAEVVAQCCSAAHFELSLSSGVLLFNALFLVISENMTINRLLLHVLTTTLATDAYHDIY